jgi:hypothetical protein
MPRIEVYFLSDSEIPDFANGARLYDHELTIDVKTWNSARNLAREIAASNPRTYVLTRPITRAMRRGTVYVR